MDKELLKRLYAIYSPSGSEKKMRKFIRKFAISCGCTAETDKFGNLFVTKGVSDTYPCLASHMDQVQKVHAKDFMCGVINGAVFGYSRKLREQQGLGADDKNGIYICLECIKKYDILKCAFFVGEEVGCTGSSDCDLDFFKDCRFIIEPDRKGSSDLITSMFCGPVCSGEFIDDIDAGRFGYSEEIGSITDVGTLVERGVGISCLNLSCGYYEPHTNNEITVLEDLGNCLEFVQYIIENCTDVYPFEHIPMKYTYGRSATYSGGSWYNPGCYSRWDGNSKSDSEDDAYENDYILMEKVMLDNPGISFEEVLKEHSMEFNSDERKLREIYDDLSYFYEDYYSQEDYDMKCWNASFGV